MKKIKHNGELVTINGHKIHVYRDGNKDAPKIVFMSGHCTVSPVYDFKVLYEKLLNNFRVIVIEKYGYDSKQLHHLMRVEEYLARYIAGESYEKCLIPNPNRARRLRAVKEDNGLLSLEEARCAANTALATIEMVCEEGLAYYPEGYNEETDELLKKVQYEIMKFAIALELAEEEYYD